MEIKSRKQYVERLRSMLYKNKSNKPCNCCPCQKRFQVNTQVFPCTDENLIDEYGSYLGVCAWCADFVDIPTDRFVIRCPCLTIPNPIEAAHAAIERWDNGTHKWHIQTIRIDEDDVTFPKAVKVK